MINGRSNGAGYGPAGGNEPLAIRHQVRGPASPGVPTHIATTPVERHAAAQRRVAAQRTGAPPSGLTDPADLYGDGETEHLAAELSELLHAVQPSALGPTPALPYPDAQRSDRGHGHMADAQASAFHPLQRPHTDFTAEDDDLQLPYAWRHEPQPERQPWLRRQLRFIAIGCLTGMAIVVPGVLMMTGAVQVPALDGMLHQASMGSGDGGAAIPRADRRVDAGETVPIPPGSPARPEARSETRPETQPASRPEARSQTASAPAATTTTPAVTAATEPRTAVARIEAQTEMQKPAISEIKARSVTTSEVFPPRVAAAPAVDPTLALFSQGHKLLQDGRIAAARAPLAQAASAGNGAAMLALAETFDPNMLAAWGASRDVKPDVATARLFYGRALAAGQSTAEKRLDLLR